MSSKPLVSAIIIFFNAEKLFKEVVERMFAQTYEKWELLLVDYGLTYGSRAIARHYTKQYPNKDRYLDHDSRQNCSMRAWHFIQNRKTK